MPSPSVHVQVHLDRVRQAAEEIRQSSGVDLIAVIKADAYGLGAVRVADALTGVASEFAYFTIEEAQQVRKPGILLGPPIASPDAHTELGLRPSLGKLEHAERYGAIPSLINLDTGMQRFGCAADQLETLLARSGSREVFTHAGNAAAVERFVAATPAELRRHVACSALLGEPQTHFDAVRPGIALYRSAVTVTTQLVEVRDPSGSSGYTGFSAERTGVILVGYSHGLRPCPLQINGRREQTLEIGMNSAYVSVGPDARIGDTVLLLGDQLPIDEVAKLQGSRPHEILCRYTGLGQREYT